MALEGRHWAFFRGDFVPQRFVFDSLGGHRFLVVDPGAFSEVQALFIEGEGGAISLEAVLAAGILKAETRGGVRALGPGVVVPENGFLVIAPWGECVFEGIECTEEFATGKFCGVALEFFLGGIESFPLGQAETAGGGEFAVPGLGATCMGFKGFGEGMNFRIPKIVQLFGLFPRAHPGDGVQKSVISFRIPPADSVSGSILGRVGVHGFARGFAGGLVGNFVGPAILVAHDVFSEASSQEMRVQRPEAFAPDFVSLEEAAPGDPKKGIAGEETERFVGKGVGQESVAFRLGGNFLGVGQTASGSGRALCAGGVDSRGAAFLSPTESVITFPVCLAPHTGI